MEQDNKEIYYSPEMNVFEVKTEGVICGSGDANATMNGVFGEETI